MKKTDPCRKRGGLWGADLYEFPSLPSTNTWAMQNLPALRHGDTVWTPHQTRGRGRFEREWLSPRDACLTISFVLDARDLPGEVASVLAQASALAVRAAVAECGAPCRVKWPNDVLSGHGKIAGILSEGDLAAGRIVLGIGLNVNFSQAALGRYALMQPATSLLIETGRRWDLQDVRKGLQAHLERTLALAEGGFDALRADWDAHDALRGREVAVTTCAETIAGRYEGIDADGRLMLTGADGLERRFWSGDVSLRAPNGPSPAPRE
jgi:BirA family biotin operon repressor/biotin-[acetyl-CoA-carboxylase] ligase